MQFVYLSSSAALQWIDRVPYPRMLLNKQTEASQKCGALSHFGSVLLFSFAASDTVDVSFKISVVDKLTQNVLHKGGNGAGVESQLFFKM